MNRLLLAIAAILLCLPAQSAPKDEIETELNNARLNSRRMKKAEQQFDSGVRGGDGGSANWQYKVDEKNGLKTLTLHVIPGGAGKSDGPPGIGAKPTDPSMSLSCSDDRAALRITYDGKAVSIPWTVLEKIKSGKL